MESFVTYGIIFIALLVTELVYFKIADKYNIIDKPNERSSHSSIVLRGGGIIFSLGILVWCGLQLSHNDGEIIYSHLPFIVGLLLVAGISFIDDIHSLPDSIRLIGQFIGIVLMFYQFGMFSSEWFVSFGWFSGLLLILVSLIVFVGATNIINFMDGVNGITGAYALGVLIPLGLLNGENQYFLRSLEAVSIISVFVFGIFNFRPKGKAKCFAGDVGSIGIAYILMFLIGNVILKTMDITYLVFLLVYGVDGCLTIIHRIMLHENLGEAHRKHAYQIMANELKIGHVKVSLLYMLLQLFVSLGFIYLCPNTITSHWVYFVFAIALLSVLYVVFMKKYYYLHENYLQSLNKVN